MQSREMTELPKSDRLGDCPETPRSVEEKALRQESLFLSDRKVGELGKGLNCNGESRDENVRTHVPCVFCDCKPSGEEYCGEACRDAEAKTWKSHVNATIRRVHSRFGNLCQATPLTWPTDRGQIEQTVRATDKAVPATGELIVIFLKQSLSVCFRLPCVSHCAGRARRSGGPIRRTTTGSGRATDSGTTAATRSADRIVSGCLGGTDPRSGYLSRPNCGSRPVDAATHRS